MQRRGAARFATAGLFVTALLLAPTVSADHAGSNLGLLQFGSTAAPLSGVSQPTVHHLPELELRLQKWESRWPQFVDRFTIGESSTGLALLSVRITDEAVPYDAAPLSTGHKLRVMLDGSHHGNEYLGTEIILYYLEGVLTKAGQGDASTLAFLATAEIYSTPIVNPEGNLLDTRKNGRQVDLNRNYPFHWGVGGSSFIADFTYKGPTPFSESETRAVAEFGGDFSPDLWITMHTGIAELYWPWGWTRSAPPDIGLFRYLEGPFEAATEGRVNAKQAAELYLASGATDDYAYGVLGVTTFTYEVHENQFIPVYGQPIPVVLQKQLAGLEFLVKNVQRMGAWFDVAIEGQDLRLTNVGWGEARNVLVTLGDRSVLLASVPRGASATIPLEAGDGTDAVVQYRVLLVDSSRLRTQHFALPGDMAAASSGSNDSMAPPLEAVLFLLVIAMTAVRAPFRPSRWG